MSSLKELEDEMAAAYRRLGELECRNADLLAALKFAMPFVPMPSGRPNERVAFVEAYNTARAAIARAEEEERV